MLSESFKTSVLSHKLVPAQAISFGSDVSPKFDISNDGFHGTFENGRGNLQVVIGDCVAPTIKNTTRLVHELESRFKGVEGAELIKPNVALSHASRCSTTMSLEGNNPLHSLV